MMDTLGDYQLITTLGRGGMADVYLAARHRHGGFTKLVVIKRLRADLYMSPDGPHYRQLLLDEANLAARLHHPNIVQTHEVHDDVGAPYLVMEYLDGQPLTQVVTAALRAGLRVPVRLALHVVAEVLAGLEHAHALCDYDGAPLAVVHRDVSPHNVFWTYAGDVKLMDFGVARSALGASLTVAGTVKGKLGYMAPEQARGEALDHRADLFAAGIVLWELLAGRRFLRAESDAGAMHKLLYEPLPSLLEVRPSLDPLVVAVVERALERDPVRRYPSAALMRADVERVLGGRAPRREELAAFVAPLFAGAREDRAARIARSRRATASSPVVAAAPSSPAHLLPVESDREPTAPVEVAASARSRPGRWRRARRGRAARAGGWSRARAVGGLGGLVAWRGRGADSPASRPAAVGLPASGPAAAPAPAPTPAPPTLRLCGSNTVGAELAPALVEAFLRRRGAPAIARTVDATGQALRATLPTGEVLVDVRAEGSATAFTGLAAGRCDVGLASRPISDDEAARLGAAGFGDPRRPAIEHVIALDGIAVIVHPDNPIAALDRAALRGVFTGAITDWAALGGAATSGARRPSGTYDTFKHLVLGAAAGRRARRFADSRARRCGRRDPRRSASSAWPTSARPARSRSAIAARRRCCRPRSRSRPRATCSRAGCSRTPPPGRARRSRPSWSASRCRPRARAWSRGPGSSICVAWSIRAVMPCPRLRRLVPGPAAVARLPVLARQDALDSRGSVTSTACAAPPRSPRRAGACSASPTARAAATPTAAWPRPGPTRWRARWPPAASAPRSCVASARPGRSPTTATPPAASATAASRSGWAAEPRAPAIAPRGTIGHGRARLAGRAPGLLVGLLGVAMSRSPRCTCWWCRGSRARAGWLAVIWLSPIVGPVVYVLLGINRIARKGRRLRPGAARGLASVGDGGDRLAAPVERAALAQPHLAALRDRSAGGPSLLGGNAIAPLVDGDAAFPRCSRRSPGRRRSRWRPTSSTTTRSGGGSSTRWPPPRPRRRGAVLIDAAGVPLPPPAGPQALRGRACRARCSCRCGGRSHATGTCATTAR
jgi:serine/threonine-protein kinase